ncbi:MAG: hypothetical protein ABIK23_04005 [candidate division WOR-3 bacterium]
MMAGTELLGEEVLAETLSKGGLMVKGGLKSVLLAGIFLLALGTTAMATDITYYSGDIWGGQTIDVGNIYAILHYDEDDPYNSILEIKYETEDGWLLSECHLWIDDTMPKQRGSPGHYPYGEEDINDDHYSFEITIQELKDRFGINWGSYVFVMPHCAVWLDDGDGIKEEGEEGETGFGGTVIKPKRGSWYGFFGFELTEPEKEPTRTLYEGETRTRGYWRNHLNEEQHGDWFPVTLAGYYIADVDAAIEVLSKPVHGKMWWQFLAQFLALYCNTQAFGDLELAYYDDPDMTGEPFENFQVQAIMDSANNYNEYTDEDILEEAKNVMDAINNNWESSHKVLWWEE